MTPSLRSGIASNLVRRAKAFVIFGLSLGSWISLLAPASDAAAPFTFEATGSLATARAGNTTTLLQNDKVLVVGGAVSPSTRLASAELYDPATGHWTATGSLATARTGHTATLLGNGKVLVAGGFGSGRLVSAELYDPVSGTWSATGSLSVARSGHTATLLANGKVLIVGGFGSSDVTAAAELYDPVTGTWSGTGSLATGRDRHTATLLQSGKVLVVGGASSNFSGGLPLATAELYDPASGIWSASGSLTAARTNHTATMIYNGKVVVIGGSDANGAPIATTELYDASTGTWGAAAPLKNARTNHTATLLPDASVLVTGGVGNGNTSIATVELFDPLSISFALTGSLVTSRFSHSATMLPNGKVLIAAGLTGTTTRLASAELYTAADGSWQNTGSLVTGRYEHTATLLADGKVLVAAGYRATSLGTAEIYDPATGNWSATGNLNTARRVHTSTLLPDGKVLVAGGLGTGNTLLASAELYDPATGTWSVTGSLAGARYRHTATLLPNGKVLVAGGAATSASNPSFLSTAEIYDPATGLWTVANNMTNARADHTATLLPGGKLLVAAGFNNASFILKSAELYDPANGTWSATGSLTTGRESSTATLLPNGKVLVAGGWSGSAPLASAELYDPGAGTWAATGSLTLGVYGHSATLLANGIVLVAGGRAQAGSQTGSAATQLYNPASGTWSATANLNSGRSFHTATLLPNGKLLAAAGSAGVNTTEGYHVSAELYNPGLLLIPDWQPQIATSTATLREGRRLSLTGSRFRGISQASGGNNGQDSSTNYPVVQLRSLISEQVSFLNVDPAFGWSDSAFISLPVTGFPAGPAVVTIFTNGIPSDSKYIVAAAASNTFVWDGGGGNANWTTPENWVGDVAPQNGDDLVFPANAARKTNTNNFPYPGYTQFHSLGFPNAAGYTISGSPIELSGGLTATPAAPGDFSIVSNVINCALLLQADQTFSSANPLTSLRVDSVVLNGYVLTMAGGGENWINSSLTGSTGNLVVAGPGITLLFVHVDDGVPIKVEGGELLVRGNCSSSSVNVVGGTLSGFDNASKTGPITASGGIVQPGPFSSSLLATTGNTAFGPGVAFTLSYLNGSATAGLVTSNQLQVTGAVNLGGSELDVVDAANLVNGDAFVVINNDGSDAVQNTFSGLPEGAQFDVAGATFSISYHGGDGNDVVLTVAQQPSPTPTPTPTATPTATPRTVLGNISTRLPVETGDNVLIGGFIITGSQPKKVIVRAIGPSLNLPGQLENPTLELYQGSTLLASNDDWQNQPDADRQAVIDSTIPPSNDLESALVRTLPANGASYTAIVRGVNNGTGIGVVEAYDLDNSVDSKLANISTRGLVQTGDNILIAGTIVIGQDAQKVIIRAIGPSLSVAGKLADPTLELRDSNGGLLQENDNWVDSPNKQAIIDSTVPPGSDLESAIVAALPANNAGYTAIVRGASGTTGIAVVEVYALP